MDLKVASSGSYPRLGRNSIGRELRQARHDFDKGKKSLNYVRVVENALAEEIIKEQEALGLDIVSDGLVRWYCPVSHIAGKLEGVKPGPLHHFLETNFHVRKAVVEDLPRWRAPLVLEEWFFARLVSSKIVKAVLMGPATLRRYTENKSVFSLEKVEEAYVAALVKEISELASAGAEFIHIDDPLLLDAGERWPFYIRAYGEFRKAASGVFLEVKTYGGYSGHLLDKFAELPVDCIGIDCVSDTAVINSLAEDKHPLSGKSLSLGVVDSRTGRIESPENIARLIEPALKYASQTLLFEPNSGLEFTARRFARAKLETLVSAKRLLEGAEQEEEIL